jgi:hypothetical protein
MHYSFLQPEGAISLRQWQMSEALSYAYLAPLVDVYCAVAPPTSQSQVRQPTAVFRLALSFVVWWCNPAAMMTVCSWQPHWCFKAVA